MWKLTDLNQGNKKMQIRVYSKALLREAFWTRNTDHSLFSPQHCSLLPKVGCWASQTQSWVHKRLLGCLRLPEVIPPIDSNG